MRICIAVLIIALLAPLSSFSQPTGAPYAQPHLYMIKLGGGKKKKPFNIKDSCYVSIVLLNDSATTIKGKFNITDGKQAIASADKTFTPADTKELYVAVSDEESISGVSKDGEWLFKTTLGYISAWGKTPEIDGSNIVGIQKAKGEIQPFSKEVLMEWLKSNEKAVKLAEKGKYVDAIKAYNM